MMGPGGASLLHKLGQKAAWEMDDAELQSLVEADRIRRTTQRAIGRAKKLISETPKARTRKVKSLDSYGLAPTIVAKLRAGGKTDEQIVKELIKAGLIS